MKIIRFLTIVFFISVLYLISGCGKPNEFASRFSIVSTSPNPGYAQSIWIGNVSNKPYAFVASGQAGMIIYNIDNPESTYIVAQWMDTTYSCWSITTLRNYAYLACSRKLLVKLDVRNFDSLTTIAEFGGMGGITGYAYDIFATDTNHVTVAARERFVFIDVTDPSSTSYAAVYLPNCARGVFVVDSFAYVACEQLGIYIFNIKTTPYLSVAAIGNCNTPSNARGVFVKDNICYVADGRNGLVLIDVTNPRQASIISELHLSGYANRVYIRDTLAYLACSDGGLSIVNIKDRTNPSLLAVVQTSYAKGVFVSDSQYIYVADRDQGLVVIKQEE
jgi:hypothetical protein